LLGLPAEVQRALEGRREVANASEVPGDWLLDSPGMTAVVAAAKKLAASPGTPAIIHGGRGSGVPELARLVHEADPQTRTGAFRSVPAYLAGPPEISQRGFHGTLLLEDVENLKPAGQAWIADLLASRPFSGPRWRIVVASRRGVGELLAERRLSVELVHALDVFRLSIPPLRTRPQDIRILAQRFLVHYASLGHGRTVRFSPGAERKLLEHSYPANVRELRNIVERSMALVPAEAPQEVPEGAIVFHDALVGGGGPRRAAPSPLPPLLVGQERLPSLDEVERDYLTLLVRKLRGRRTTIARAMGVSYPTVIKMIARHSLDVRAILKATLD
jgi:two-component system nitrogen regulation response regulator NtrX